MISDVLAEATTKIDRYLSDDVFANCYEGEMRTRILKLRDEMESVRIVLDTPPSDCDPT